MTSETLGRFGHHPDPAIDFEIEVQAIEGLAYNRKVGLADERLAGLDDRIFRAMQFNVGGDAGAIRAKQTLREIERAALAPPAPEDAGPTRAMEEKQ